MQMLALKHARMGGDPEAVAHVKKEIAIMKVLRGGDNIMTLRSVAFTGPTDQVRSRGWACAALEGIVYRQFHHDSDGAMRTCVSLPSCRRRKRS